MTTKPRSAQPTPAHWSASLPPGLVPGLAPGVSRAILLFTFAVLVSAQSPADLTQLANGIQKIEDQSYEQGAAQLKGLAAKLPAIGDYPRFHLASAYFELKSYSDAAAVLIPVYRDTWGGLVSPFAGRAAILASNSLIELGKPRDAIAILRQYAQKIPEPNREIALAKAFEAAGEAVAAAGHYQQVFYYFPAWERVDEAVQGLARLQEKLGAAMPPVMPRAILARVKALSEARKFTEARAEIDAALPQFTGADRDLAQVEIGAIDYRARRLPVAYNYLKALPVTNGDAGAARLYYLIETCRRLSKSEEIPPLLERLQSDHPKSPWRLEAMVDVAYDYLYRNEPSNYIPLYRDCADTFADRREAGFCHWKITWEGYLRGETEKDEILKAHLRRFPESEKVPASLYFLGRLAERRQQYQAAKGYYQEVSFRFPNHYYAVLSRKQLETREVAAVSPAPDVAAFVASLNLPQKRKSVSFVADALTRQRLERARLLNTAGLTKSAEEELRFGARNDSQPQLLAMELAKALEKRGAADEALRSVKSLVPDYLMYPMEDAPPEFWRLAFPMPFREPLIKNARSSELDPFVVAGLIRQESEFNPKAVSRAYALGLTQVLPSTGRDLSRRVGMRRFTSAMLFEPDTNLRLGTFYIRMLLNSFSGKWEQTLASYNGGKTRVLRWEEWGKFNEPAEFVETIPIQETRDYVQIVMRNATVYRQLYQGMPLEVRSTDVPAKAAVAQKAPPPKSTPKSAARPAPAAAPRKVSRPKNAQVH